MKTAKEIIRDLLISAQTNSVLKIQLKGVKNPVITAVESVGRKRILLKPTCLYGYALKKRSIALADIVNVVRYKTRFNNPMFEKLRFIRKNISNIRQNFGSVNEPQAGVA